MKSAALSTVCLILILTTQAWAQGQNSIELPQATPAGRFSADWRLRLSGTDIHDEQSQAKIVDIRTEVRAKYLLNNSLSLDIQPSLRLQSGQTQSFDGADKPENKISLNQAAAHYLPMQSLKLSAGALNQKYMHTNLLIDPIAFPAARMAAAFKTGNFTTGFALESAIPTSTSLSTNTKELEATPSLNSALVKTTWKNADSISARVSAGYFAYNNLPSAVAQKSRLLGNEINKISEAQYSFVNKFEGFEAKGEVEFSMLSELNISLGAEFLINQKGPENMNKASTYFGKGEIHLSQNKDLIIGAGYFSIAPEAAVSYFNASAYETNRVGYMAEVALAFKKEAFTVGVKYTDAEVMFAHTFQSREKTLLIKLETSYANL